MSWLYTVSISYYVKIYTQNNPKYRYYCSYLSDKNTQFSKNDKKFQFKKKNSVKKSQTKMTYVDIVYWLHPTGKIIFIIDIIFFLWTIVFNCTYLHNIFKKTIIVSSVVYLPIQSTKRKQKMMSATSRYQIKQCSWPTDQSTVHIVSLWSYENLCNQVHKYQILQQSESTGQTEQTRK